jgi:hypothetical protein
MSTKVTTLVVGMFLTGCANSLLSKYQDMQCVEGCDTEQRRLDFEQPVSVYVEVALTIGLANSQVGYSRPDLAHG